ncbi:MAG: hypothetical protein HRU12_09795, partial [Phaeodactylibacter sp.]|nr:hypothetical protein [Phaeodactylibacter sp.]
MLPCQRHLFDLSDEVAYLNGAYMSPQLRHVEATGIQALKRKSQPYNIQVEDFFEPVDELKMAYSKLINCSSPDRIAIYSYAHVTWVAKQQRGFERKDLPGPEVRLELFTLALQRLMEVGYIYLGLDHFARPDDELS